MKKHLAADVLAARLSAAANQPPAVTDAPAPPPTVEQAPTETMRKQPKLKAVLTAKDADEKHRASSVFGPVDRCLIVM